MLSEEDRVLSDSSVGVLERLRTRAIDTRDLLGLGFGAFAVLLAIAGVRTERPELVAVGIAAALVARGVFIGRHFLIRNGAFTLLAIATASLADIAGHRPAAAWAASTLAGALLVLPESPPRPADEAERRHVWALVNRTSDDTLAPFVLRTDKSYVFSPDRDAAVAYRVRFGIAVVSGNPVGDPGSFAAAIDEFVNHARAHGWRPAVLGSGEGVVDLWRAHGLRAIPIGRDVVIEVADFAMLGRRCRNLRQAVQRTRNAGVSIEVAPERALDPRLRVELDDVLAMSRKGHQPRGFAMILDQVLTGVHPGTLICVARDRHGRVVGFQRFASADGGRELTLDLPWRVPGAPNGIDERMVVEMVEWGRVHGARRVSLAFAAFPELFATSERGLLQRLAYWGVHRLDRLIRLESLYRFLRKFNALDRQRFAVLRARDIVWVAAAMLTLEFGPGVGLRRGAGRS